MSSLNPSILTAIQEIIKREYPSNKAINDTVILQELRKIEDLKGLLRTACRDEVDVGKYLTYLNYEKNESFSWYPFNKYKYRNHNIHRPIYSEDEDSEIYRGYRAKDLGTDKNKPLTGSQKKSADALAIDRSTLVYPNLDKNEDPTERCRKLLDAIKKSKNQKFVFEGKERFVLIPNQAIVALVASQEISYAELAVKLNKMGYPIKPTLLIHQCNALGIKEGDKYLSLPGQITRRFADIDSWEIYTIDQLTTHYVIKEKPEKPIDAQRAVEKHGHNASNMPKRFKKLSIVPTVNGNYYQCEKDDAGQIVAYKIIARDLKKIQKRANVVQKNGSFLSQDLGDGPVISKMSTPTGKDKGKQLSFHILSDNQPYFSAGSRVINRSNGAVLSFPDPFQGIKQDMQSVGFWVKDQVFYEKQHDPKTLLCRENPGCLCQKFGDHQNLLAWPKIPSIPPFGAYGSNQPGFSWGW